MDLLKIWISIIIFTFPLNKQKLIFEGIKKDFKLYLFYYDFFVLRYFISNLLSKSQIFIDIFDYLL